MKDFLVDVMDDHDFLSVEQAELVCNLITFVDKKERGEKSGEVSVTFVSNDEMKALNHQYRGKDEPTDVLSFPMDEDDLPMLGDIVISVVRAKEQAVEFGHSFERELGFLLVHGFLHLIGYDHIEREDEKIMNDRQEEMLMAFGLNR